MPALWHGRVATALSRHPVASMIALEAVVCGGDEGEEGECWGRGRGRCAHRRGGELQQAMTIKRWGR